MLGVLKPDRAIGLSSLDKITDATYTEVEREFDRLLVTENLDRFLADRSSSIDRLENTIAHALDRAYREETEESDRSRLFLQRILYKINRLHLFWYDNLQAYKNERSIYLQLLRDRIESAWQEWESKQIDIEAIRKLDVKQALQERNERDLNPEIAENKRFLREEMSFAGYRCLLAIASLDGLVEASRMSRILGGASNQVQATLIRVLLEEYGNGNLKRKHSTFFASMMAELGLKTEPEAYFEIVPWEVLASINHNFLLTECKRYFLRYNGGLTYFEIAGPSIYEDYRIAAERLGLSETAMGYWKLHIQEDERHGRWMLRDVALPLVDMYPEDSWQIVLGYDQEKSMGDRAGSAVIKAIKQLESNF
ncbi:iron-containing redox enzyme family protein [Pannus brasiliensis CCIBt3594]|uniref:Iron-containing redox enzyme family protein n=1 Tax=Pannus brasiliensis CCIBt3594 TaxID=1427578 RepID=A0AAW9QUJ4_9CHRO